MQIQNNPCNLNFKARFSDDYETKQVLSTAMRDGTDAAHTVFSTIIKLKNLESDDVLSMRKIHTMYQIKNENTQKYTYIVPDKFEKGNYMTDYSNSANLATTIHNAIFGHFRNTVKLFGKVPEDKKNYIDYHKDCFEKLEKETDYDKFKDLKTALQKYIKKLQEEIKSKQEIIDRKETEIKKLQEKHDNKEREYILSLLD